MATGSRNNFLGLALGLICFAFAQVVIAQIQFPTTDPNSFNKAPTPDIGSGTAQSVGDLFTGSLSNSYPISVPAGRRGIQPSLALVYNSRVGASWVGRGWSLTGLGTISRSLKYGTPTYTDRDIFLYNGAELVPPLTTETVYGYTGQVYRLKLESGFMKIIKDEVNNRWIVKDLQGTQYYFGDDPNTASNENARTGDPAVSRIFSTTFEWYLVALQDVYGNYMAVQYYPYLSTDYKISGGLLPSDIYYTGWRGSGSSPLDPYYHIYFELAPYSSDPNDTIIQGRAGYLAVIGSRLARIIVSSEETGATIYLLSYNQTSVADIFLSSIKISAGGSSLPATTFTYNQNESSNLGFATQTGNMLPTPFFSPANDDDHKQSGRAVLADVNGDGWNDVVVAVSEGFFSPPPRQEVFLNKADGTGWHMAP